MNRNYVYSLTVFLGAGMIAKEGLDGLVWGIPMIAIVLGSEWLLFRIFGKMKSLPETIEEAEKAIDEK